MTDELVERLLDWPYQGETMAHEAADRIAQLTAERDKYESSWMTAEGKLADAEALIEAQAKDHASNNIRFAESEHRAKVAEAESDRLREALTELLEVSRRAVRLSVEHDNFKLYAMEPMERAILLSRYALKGESHE